MKKIAYGVGGVVALVLVAGIFGDPVPSDPSRELLASARARVKERLKDPESAQFGRVWTPDTATFCGYVNSKNSFGGYNGEELFYGFGSLVYFDSDLKDLTAEEAKLPKEIRAKCEGN